MCNIFHQYKPGERVMYLGAFDNPEEQHCRYGKIIMTLPDNLDVPPGGISLVRFDDRYIDIVLNDDLQLVEVPNEQ